MTRHSVIPCSRLSAQSASAALNAAAASLLRISILDLQKSGLAIDGTWSRSAARRFAVSISSRAVDLAQLPVRQGKNRRRQGPGVFAVALSRLLFVLRVTGVERPFAMGPRLGEIADKVARNREAGAKGGVRDKLHVDFDE